MRNGLHIYLATQVESEQGEGYDETVFVIARNEDSAFKKFIKEFNSRYITYLYYWIGDIEKAYDKDTLAEIYEDYENEEVGVYYPVWTY